MTAISKTECWEWGGTHRQSDGRPTHRSQYVYRLVYEAATGEPCPEGKVAHHKCEHAWCINPWHLEFITQRDHMTEHKIKGGDWGQAQKTRCANGHPYSEENTYIYKRKDGTTERHCRQCNRDAKQRRRNRK